MTLPKPYYQDSACTIYHADCREILPVLPKVDLVLTDFPYGIGESYHSYEDNEENLKTLINSSMPLIIAGGRVALITCGVKNMFLYPRPNWILCWTSSAGTGCSPWGFCCWQPILAYGKDPYLTNKSGSLPDLFQSNETSVDYGHPCSKPISLWSKILLRGSFKKEDVILDPFMGSGTTLRAAKNLGRKAIGIEICEAYCEIAAKRLAQEVLTL